MSTHNLCFEQNYEKYQSFLSDNLKFLEVKFSIYLDRRVFIILRYSFDSSLKQMFRDILGNFSYFLMKKMYVV